MKLGQILLTVVLSIAAAYAVVTFSGKQAGTAPQKETAYERVMKTGTLRCGYVIYARFMDRDPNTGAFSGLAYELVNEIANQLNWKVEWAEEVGMANIFEGLKAGRYDAICSTIAIVPNRVKNAEFTRPFAYFPSFAYARIDDARFDNDYSKIDDPNVKVTYLEGEMGQVIKEQDFPKAASLSLQNLTGFSDVPLQVAMGKADVMMGEPSEVDRFIEKNPGKIKQIPGPPLRMQALSMQVPVGEEALKNVLDLTIMTLQNNGFIDRLYEKALGKPGHYYFLPSKPWQLEEGGK